MRGLCACLADLSISSYAAVGCAQELAQRKAERKARDAEEKEERAAARALEARARKAAAAAAAAEKAAAFGEREPLDVCGGSFFGGGSRSNGSGGTRTQGSRSRSSKEGSSIWQAAWLFQKGREGWYTHAVGDE